MAESSGVCVAVRAWCMRGGTRRLRGSPPLLLASRPMGFGRPSLHARRRAFRERPPAGLRFSHETKRVHVVQPSGGVPTRRMLTWIPRPHAPARHSEFGCPSPPLSRTRRRRFLEFRIRGGRAGVPALPARTLFWISNARLVKRGKAAGGRATHKRTSPPAAAPATTTTRNEPLSQALGHGQVARGHGHDRGRVHGGNDVRGVGVAAVQRVPRDARRDARPNRVRDAPSAVRADQH